MKPTFVFGHDVEENIAVDRDGGHSFIPGHRHYRVGAHCDVTAPAQRSNHASAASVFVAAGGAQDPHNPAVELEIDFRVGQQACPFADVGRNCHLPLRCYAYDDSSCYV